MDCSVSGRPTYLKFVGVDLHCMALFAVRHEAVRRLTYWWDLEDMISWYFLGMV